MSGIALDKKIDSVQIMSKKAKNLVMETSTKIYK